MRVVASTMNVCDCSNTANNRGQPLASCQPLAKDPLLTESKLIRQQLLPANASAIVSWSAKDLDSNLMPSLTRTPAPTKIAANSIRQVQEHLWFISIFVVASRGNFCSFPTAIDFVSVIKFMSATGCQLGLIKMATFHRPLNCAWPNRIGRHAIDVTFINGRAEPSYRARRVNVVVIHSQNIIASSHGWILNWFREQDKHLLKVQTTTQIVV